MRTHWTLGETLPRSLITFSSLFGGICWVMLWPCRIFNHLTILEKVENYSFFFNFFKPVPGITGIQKLNTIPVCPNRGIINLSTVTVKKNVRFRFREGQMMRTRFWIMFLVFKAQNSDIEKYIVRLLQNYAHLSPRFATRKVKCTYLFLLRSRATTMARADRADCWYRGEYLVTSARYQGQNWPHSTNKG
jgi:hypothetical protein